MKRYLTPCTAAVLLIAGCGDKEDGGQPDGAENRSSSARKSGERGTQGSPSVAVEPVEALAEEVRVQFDNFARALESARSEGTAGKLKEIVPLVNSEIKSIAERLSRLPEPSDETRRRIAHKMAAREAEMAKTFGSLDSFLKNLDPGVRDDVEEGLQSFLGAMADVEEVFSKYFDVEQNLDTPLPPPPPGVTE